VDDQKKAPKTQELAPVQRKMSTTFDPAAMQAKAKRMLQDGTMPSEARLEAALERIREEYAAKILEAKERDQRENSAE
jgi:hypothetical protein